jgi:radical SAM protein with 4Fe4S-binding SPASM domain
VTPCPYLAISTGNIREQDFGDIWNNSSLFSALRNPSLKGKCKGCSFRCVCGGCRARAYATYNDYLEEDPWCSYIPDGGEVVKPPTFDQDKNTSAGGSIKPHWTEEAEERLKRVPSFVRTMVRSAAERYAIEHNYHEITPQMMDELKQKAGMGGMHGHR